MKSLLLNRHAGSKRRFLHEVNLCALTLSENGDTPQEMSSEREIVYKVNILNDITHLTLHNIIQAALTK